MFILSGNHRVKTKNFLRNKWLTVVKLPEGLYEKIEKIQNANGYKVTFYCLQNPSEAPKMRTRRTSWDWAVPSSGSTWLTCWGWASSYWQLDFIFGLAWRWSVIAIKFTLLSSSYLDHLPLKLSSIEVVFHWGHLTLRLSSIFQKFINFFLALPYMGGNNSNRTFIAFLSINFWIPSQDTNSFKYFPEPLVRTYGSIFPRREFGDVFRRLLKP